MTSLLQNHVDRTSRRLTAHVSQTRVVPHRTPRAPWNEHRWRWLGAYRALRKFRNVALRWIYRFARADRGWAYRPGFLARRLFTEILTDKSHYIDGKPYLMGDNEREILDMDARHNLGANLRAAPRRTMRAEDGRLVERSGPMRFQLVVRVPKDRVAGYAWGCGQVAVSMLRDRLDARWFVHAEGLTRGPLPAPDAENRIRLPWEVWNTVEHFVAHMIGDKLLEGDRIVDAAQAAKGVA